MHIVDGALSAEVLTGGALLTVVGVGYGLKRLDLETIPTAGVLSAAFFAASLISVPVGPASTHLILNGLAGLVLGWVAFPALFVGLLLQAVFFGFGGITVLGVNTVNIAVPAIAAYYICRLGLRANPSPRAAFGWGALGGGVAVALTTVAVALALALSGDEFLTAAKLIVLAHIPIMMIEACLCGAAVALIARVKPELIMPPPRPPLRPAET